MMISKRQKQLPLSLSFKRCSVALLLRWAVPVKENCALSSHELPDYLVLADHFDLCKHLQSKVSTYRQKGFPWKFHITSWTK